MLKQLTQRGDTIVEVLIALAILGSAFGISYATASKGLQAARNAEEHSQALQYINKQAELLRAAAGNTDANAPTGIFKQTVPFCLLETPPSPVQVIPFTSGWVPASQQPDNDVQNAATKYPGGCSADNLYYYSIRYVTGSNDVFQILIRWEGLGTLGAQQETISYKVHP